MTPAQWKQIKYFSPDENFGDPSKMDYSFMLKLDYWRSHLEDNERVYVLEGFATQGHAKHSYHGKGMAVDCRIIKGDLIRHLFAVIHAPFGGCGLYTWGAGGPFMHFDDRPQLYKKTIWVSFKKGEYVPFDENSLNRVLELAMFGNA